MGLPGLAVALCFATASASFIVALAYTTVANILLMQAGVPLIAALMAWMLFRENVAPGTWAAIAAVICGVAIMVSESFNGQVSPIGDGLALLIAFMFATARSSRAAFSHVRMTPATCLGTIIAALAASRAHARRFDARHGVPLRLRRAQSRPWPRLFASGARRIPAACRAARPLEPVLAPIWVWLIHGEVPSVRTIVGGTVVFLALLVHI